MTRFVRIPAFLAMLLLPLGAAAQDTGLKADVAIALQQDGKIWSGQQLTLNLDLKTTGFSFSDTHFNLPEVGEAFLMQTDTTTIKFSEKKDGEDWQVIRYPLALYPLKSGPLTIPPIDIRFSSSAGYGTTVKDFEFQTEPLRLTVSLPPGVAADELVVSTGSFQLEHDWQGVMANAKTGDAFTLTVKRRATDISAMLLPPLPVYQTEGLAAYPQTPEVRDKTDRGSLVGERTDSIIWVAEKPGSFEIPGIRFQWWDPLAQQLKQQVVPGIKLDISPSPGDRAVGETGATPETRPGVAVGETGATPETRPGVLLAGLIFLAVVAAGAALWRRSVKHKSSTQRVDEKTAFLTLQNACKGHQAGETYSALHQWIAFQPRVSGPRTQPPTLLEFARSLNDGQLEKELQELQTAMIGERRDWQGQSLLVSIKRIRRKIQTRHAKQTGSHLAPLNP